jgi:hypothetical protein
VRIAVDEPGRVVLGGRLRAAGRTLRFPATVLEFRSAGAARLTLRLSPADRGIVRRARSGRLTLGVTTADVAGNARRSSVGLRLAR